MLCNSLRADSCPVTALTAQELAHDLLHSIKRTLGLMDLFYQKLSQILFEILDVATTL